MLTEQHAMESLSRAYIHAIAAEARINLKVEINTDEYDYGVDGAFKPIKFLGSERVSDGFILDFQLKATTNWSIDSTHVIYDMEVSAYNKVVDRNNTDRAVPMILILLCLPKDRNAWTDFNEDNLLLRKCCYWERLTGALSDNIKKMRIKIVRTQLLTPTSLVNILGFLKSGVWR
ncbi:MAG: DUF4365 domain-containing protein [Acidobacteriota bacterium]